MEFVNLDLINEKKINELKEEFAKNEPYKHLFIKGFLDEGKASEILRELKKEEFEHKESDLFSLNQTEDFKFTKNRILKELYSSLKGKEFFKWLEEISGIKLEGEIDVSGSLYKNCDYLLCHDDQLESRKIAFVYYLSEGFDEKDGGEFVMFDSEKGKPWRVAKKYPPLWNSLLIFEVSEKSFHEVGENVGQKDRYAIGGWFH
ncbi:MAG: 2OG-Fe(II) oxygenase family protein [Nanoarchaeota archaeon]|nr:2OG-Fe(II) oxygenase family protein [Nanoarchaeota archaeon]